MDALFASPIFGGTLRNQYDSESVRAHYARGVGETAPGEARDGGKLDWCRDDVCRIRSVCLHHSDVTVAYDEVGESRVLQRRSRWRLV